MSPSPYVPFLATAFLIAPAALPTVFVPSTTISLSGSALAQKTPTTDAINLNSSKSNVDRMGGGGGVTKKQGKTKQSNTKPAGIEPRMGGGGGTSSGGGRY